MKPRILAISLLLIRALCAQEPEQPADPAPAAKAEVVEEEYSPRAVEIVDGNAGRAPALERAISRTGQFRVSGGAPMDRGNVLLFAEDAKSDLISLTEEENLAIEKRSAWKVPVTVLLHGQPGDPMPPRTIATKIQVSEAGYEIVMDVHLSRGVEQERFKQAVTAALIYERSLRNQPLNETDIPYHVAPWLVEGLREAMAWRLNQSDRRLYEAIFKTGGLFKTDELFSLSDSRFEDMDGAMRAAFRVSSGAMVMALLQQPQGRAGFRAFLDEAASFQGEMPSLMRKHFPELNLSETSLAKWWALQLANIGGQNLATDVMTIVRTEEALKDALRINFKTEEGILRQEEISSWQEVADLPEGDRVNSVRLAQDSLVRLSYRCFPSYRPIIAEYQLVLAAIARDKTKDVPAQLVALEERRTIMLAKAEMARDYMNWFEITRATDISGEFEDYMRLQDRLKSNPHHRRDHISEYLDRMDEIFGRGLDAKPAADDFSDPLAMPDGIDPLPMLPPLPSY